MKTYIVKIEHCRTDDPEDHINVVYRIDAGSYREAHKTATKLVRDTVIWSQYARGVEE